MIFVQIWHMILQDVRKSDWLDGHHRRRKIRFL